MKDKAEKTKKEKRRGIIVTEFSKTTGNNPLKKENYCLDLKYYLKCLVTILS